MAKKKAELKPDADGYLRTGIYRRKISGGPSLSADDFEKQLDAVVAEGEKTANQILADYRQKFQRFIKRFTSGVATWEQVKSEHGNYLPIDLGDGRKIYSMTVRLSKQARSVEEHQVSDAVEALHEIDSIAAGLRSDDSARILRSSIALGGLLERIAIRPAEPAALTGVRVTQGASDGGSLNAAMTTEQEMDAANSVARLIQQGFSQNTACKQIASQHGVSPSTVAKAFRKSKRD